MFLNKNLSVLAYANGFTLWHYMSKEDDLETIRPTGILTELRRCVIMATLLLSTQKIARQFAQ